MLALVLFCVARVMGFRCCWLVQAGGVVSVVRSTILLLGRLRNVSRMGGRRETCIINLPPPATPGVRLW